MKALQGACLGPARRMIVTRALQRRKDVPMGVWSTDHVPSGESFAFWNDAVCAAFLKVTTNRTVRSPFRGRLDSTRVGALAVNTIKAAPYQVSNGRDGVADHDWLFVNIHHHGRCQISQSGRSHAVDGADDISLNAGGLAFDLDFQDPFGLTCFRLPYEAMASRVIDLDDSMARSLPDCGAARLFKGYAKTMAANAGMLGVSEHGAADAFCDLLTLAIGANRYGVETGRASARREAFRQSCSKIRLSISDPGFDIGALAASVHLAPRTLQTLFKEHGATFTECLLEARLKAAQTRLERGSGSISMSQIAYAVGFSDLSYFSRAFRRRFDLSPSDYRKKALADQIAE